MSGLSDRDILLEHALSNQKNLEIMLNINFELDELRKRIITGFLDKLEEFVLDKLKPRSDSSEWEIVIDADHRNLRESPLEKCLRFGFGKNSWENQYGVALEPQQDNAGDVRIGVWRWYDEANDTGAPRFEPEELKELNKIRPGGNNNWWEWHYLLDAPYRDWGTKDGLVKLKFHENEALNHIGQKLVKIIEVMAPIIDARVQGS